MVLDPQPGKMEFQPSKELQQARELTEIAQQTGHPRPILDYTGVYALFDVLEREERKVFDLQISTGRLALELDKAQEMCRRLLEVVKGEAYMWHPDCIECLFCEATHNSKEDIPHEADCLITEAERIAK